MKLQFAIAAASAILGCKGSANEQPAVKPVENTPSAPAPAVAPPAVTTFRIDNIGTEPLQIDAPSSFTLSIEKDPLIAKLKGNDLELSPVFSDPDGDENPYETLKAQGIKFLTSSQHADGFEVIYPDLIGSGKFGVDVARTKLKVLCSATVNSRAAADRAAALCKTMRKPG